MQAEKLRRGCIDCGYNKHPAALDFDHIVGEKKFALSKVSRSLEALKDEIAKCVVRCSNCHRIRTFEIRQSAVDKRTLRMEKDAAMSSTAYTLSRDLFLIKQVLSQNTPPTAAVETAINHLVVIDCSGSMSWDLPKIREQLKRKVPKLLKEQDTISIIWFSGRRQFGTLLEAEPVATLVDLQDVERAIDRWLKPVGLTGFREPLEEAAKVVERVSKARKGSVASLFFMSDGCDNQWDRAEILKATETAAGGFASTTFVEYGYYADRPLLTAMAEKSGHGLLHGQGTEGQPQRVVFAAEPQRCPQATRQG
jgi:hypothetical protein